MEYTWKEYIYTFTQRWGIQAFLTIVLNVQMLKTRDTVIKTLQSNVGPDAWWLF